MKLNYYSKARLKNLINKKRSSPFPPLWGDRGAYYDRKNFNECRWKTQCSKLPDCSFY
jgi:hypothetical protein